MEEKWRKYRVHVLVVFWVIIAGFATAWAGVRMGIIGDQFGVRGRVGTPEFDRNLDGAYKAMAAGVDALNQAGPMDLVLHMGDFTESAQTPEKRAGDFARGTAILDRLDSQSRPKWFLTPGDHDVNPLEWVQNSSDRSREKDFQALYVRENPRVAEALYYSFDVQGYHFVALYSHDQLRSDPRWGNIWLARIGAAQLDWLEADLKKADTSKGVIVFTHQPLWYNAASWQPVHALLARYNTKLVLAGHTHYDQKDMAWDGIQYMVVGATGGSVKPGNARAGGWWHVTRLTLDDDGRASWQLIPVGAKAKADFTPRYDMDRVQNLNIILANAARQLGQQTVYLKAGNPVDEDGINPAALSLTAMGNPVDVAVDFEISLEPEAGVSWKQAGFEPGTFQGPPGKTRAWLKPGANIASSNTSTVKPACAKYSPDFTCLEFKRLWTGVLARSGRGNVPETGIPMGLKLTYPARDGLGDMVLEERVKIPVTVLP